MRLSFLPTLACSLCQLRVFPELRSLQIDMQNDAASSAQSAEMCGLFLHTSGLRWFAAPHVT